MNAFSALHGGPGAVSMAMASGRVQLVTIRQQSLDLARWRVLWIALAFAFLAMLALLRIAYLGAGGEGARATSLEDALLPSRGQIVDRNGVPMARAFPAYALWFNPDAMGEGEDPLVASPASLAKKLKAIFPDLDEKAVAEQFAKRKAGYIRKRLLPEEANRVHELGELALEMPTEEDRHYPQGAMGAHVLGYVAADGKGRVGMEQVFDEHLSSPLTRGTPVALSIDVRVQGALEDELRRGMKLTQAQGGAGIVLDVDTGEVLALASLPEFDPNKIDAEGEKLMFNRVTNQVYELGSTFKPLTVAAAIDNGTIRDLGRRFDASPVKVGRFTIRDSHAMGPTLNAVETLIHSSNTTTARIADEVGPERMRQYMIDLGMNARPEIELPAKGFPLWPGEKWARLTNMTVGFGHGIAVTPLHLASAYATMVNGGVYRPATLKKLGPGEAPKGRRVFKASTSSRMRQMMRAIAVYGTGRNADAKGYRVGGKTGSAEKPGGKAGYRRTALVSTFAAAFPMDRPRYVVIAMLDEPKGTLASSYQRTAAWNAAPIVGRLVPRIGPLIGVRPEDNRDIDISAITPLIPEARNEAE